MKKTLSLIVLSIILNLAILWAAEVAKPAMQTREDLYILIKEELILTVDIYKGQVQILSMILDLEKKDLKQRNADLSSQIDNLRMLKIYEGKSNEEQMVLLQKQLDTTREDLANAYLNLDQLNLKLKQTEAKILDYYARVNSRAQQIIGYVEKDKSPKLSPDILSSMKANYAIMNKATASEGMDAKAFEGFQKATADYIKFVASTGGDTQALDSSSMLINEYYASAAANQKQYGDLQLYISSYQQMLDSEHADKEALQRRLDELRSLPFGKTYEDKIYFASGSVELDKDAIRILHEFANSVPAEDDYEIMITGFCDDTPIGAALKKKYASNWELSLARSSKVVRYMLETLKFPPEKIIIAGKGEFNDDLNSAINDKRLSRKVEFRFVPKARK
ncbi:MAG: OmpA family protein [Candidatus Cloacimonetes bacterium]|nr:OmpA family protein [Candidatus Cloacimonadota bacterium]MDD3235232.1 OmpA family protein [Candidatus Cloacimonadota bacterium]